MASNYNLPFQIQTPQEIISKLQQERRAMFGSGNVAAMHQATVSNALDALFGNPDVKQAQKIQSRIASATANIQPQEGDDDVTAEIRRLSAMRDAVSDIDPELSGRISSHMLQLGTIAAERAKLSAQTVKANVGTAKDILGMQTSVAKEGREAAREPAELAQIAAATASSRASTLSKSAERTNWMKPGTDQMKSVANTDLGTQARLSADGWIEAGNPQLQGSKEDIGLTKPVITDLQTNIAGSQKQLDTFYGIAGKYKPEFLEIPEQWAQGANKAWEKMGGKPLAIKKVADAEQYYAFRRNTLGGLNEYIKYVTGAQAAVAEYKRIERAFPNMEMSPTEFISSLREVTRQSLQIEKRSQMALASGFKPSPAQLEACNTEGKACVWESMQLPTVSDAEVDRFLAPLGIPASGNVRKTSTTGFKPYTAPNGAKVLGIVQ